MRKPFYRQNRDTWFVWIDGKQERLGKGISEEEAWTKYQELLSALENEEIKPDTHVTVLLDSFLDWVTANRAERTYDWYVMFLSDFAKSIKNLQIRALKPHHVEKWSRQYPSNSTRHGAIRSVERCFNWAINQGYLTRSPLAGIEKPMPGRREAYVSADQWIEILDREKNLNWNDFITVLHETGCRSQEMRRVEAQHVDLVNERWVLPPSKAKGKQFPRVVYLNDKSLAIVKRRAKENPDGPIFRNAHGLPISRNAVRCRFRKHKDIHPDLCATLARHSYATDALSSGVDAITLGVLMGHSDPSMISRVYQHLAQKPKHLIEQAKKARPSDA